jgi:DNA-binding response OmpR family regulator
MPHILIVEDTTEISEALQHHLERQGYTTSLATKAAHALALVSSARPDLIILDLGLPDRDGYEVLEQLRGRGYESPVLILSARKEEADKVRGFRLGAEDYVTKPFGALELLERIAALLRRSARVSAAATPVREELSDEELQQRFGLTERQVLVARLLAQGLSNTEIAERMKVSAHTARNHTYQVLQKLSTSKRARVPSILRGELPDGS